MATVSELISYPIKGCAGTPAHRATATDFGLAHDRTFMFVTPDGLVRTQRTSPLLATVRPEVGNKVGDGGKLTLSAAGATDLVVDVRADGARCPVQVHNWHGEAVEQDADAGAWASELLGEPVRLVRMAPDHARRKDDWHGSVSFADSTALHATGLSSLDDLNGRIVAGGGKPVPMARFRPNIVLAGLPPYAEDGLRELTIGGVELAWVKPDVRCLVTMTDQHTGERVGPEPLRTLAGYRREPEGGVSFGIKLAVRRPGDLAVGDEVVVGASI